jgi:hypothetical protein
MISLFLVMKYFQRDSVLWDLLSSTFEGRKIFAKNPAFLEGRIIISDWIEQKIQHLKGGRFSPKIQHFLRGGLSGRPDEQKKPPFEGRIDDWTGCAKKSSIRWGGASKKKKTIFSPKIQHSSVASISDRMCKTQNHNRRNTSTKQAFRRCVQFALYIYPDRPKSQPPPKIQIIPEVCQRN